MQTLTTQPTAGHRVQQIMQALLLKRQRDGLTPQETREAERLLHSADRTMLLRAQATVLLKARAANATFSQPMAASTASRRHPGLRLHTNQISVIHSPSI
ncbi:MAG: hypothetical protein WA029_02200 [Anaerolineae bacterium]